MAKTALPVSPYFVLREKPWNIITSHLVVPSSSRQKIFPITGMGGCGKTQLVSYFLREYPNLYVQTIYVDASSSSSIKAHLQTWARALGGGHERDVWEDAMRILKTAPRGERWILVFDNADNPRLNLTPFLPINTEVTIVITSRNHALGNLSTTHHLELGEMTADEALAAMLQAARRQLPLSDEEMGSAQELLMELGCLAVALVQAGTYCRQLSSTIGDILRPYTFTQYLRLFKSHRADLMKKAEPSSLDNYQRGAYTTLDLSYTALAQESRDLLHILSLFHYSDIPLAAFARAATHAFKDQEEYHPRDNSYEATISKLKDLLYRDMEWNEIHLQEIIQNLRSFSLVTASTMNDSLFLQLHPLIQAWCRDMKLIAAQPYRAMTMQVLTASNYVSEGRWAESEKLYAKLVKDFGQIRGEGHPETMAVASSLATSYYHQGRWIEAEKLLLKVAGQHMIILGMDHPETIKVASMLAASYSAQGRWAESERLEVDALAQRKRILGIDHPDTILSAANLAMTYRSQGRLTESEKLGVEVLEQRRRILGIEHPETVFAASNLSTIYQSQGRWAEAEKLGAKVLEQRRRILGVEHPDTIKAALNLVVTYASQGRWAEAEKLGAEVLEQQRRIQGSDHPDAILAAANLSGIYQIQNRYEEATALLAPAVQAGIKVLGQDHPNTQADITNLTFLYEKLGQSRNAQEISSLLYRR
ncbi:hypothetical protein M408DRAFT_324451 [Serendipita vermifera MAFF 305830]|uniref:ORC1/DEAH AAA+ ATPase domain-containing protein n=1 Tax=Serendipita vermifera MAFF 305830 TaxID=933852 RepID=A0A0C3B0N0_SERVB|nr:hypothetical protein M408DRAFT_324451 [Serendipita vermifera MAFF 305830]